MQELVAAYPELISDQDGALLLIRREQPIADREDGGGRWSLDHLFVTKTGVPVLVELKRAVDTRLRREVVGQLLDYAANATAYWHEGRVAESFAVSMAEQGKDPDEELASFLGGSSDPDGFWQQVDANFSAGRIKLVIVADTIPRELARIVEFLNEQMKADVRAVELSWFESEGGITALTPSIIGETERARSAKSPRAALPPIGRDGWIAEHLAPLGDETRRAAASYVALVEQAGGHAEVTTAQASLIAVFDYPSDTLYPMTLSRYGKGSVQLCLSYLASRPAFAAEETRQTLYERLSQVAGPLSTKKLNGFPSFPVTRLNEPDVQAGVLQLLKDINAAMSSTK
ncbi:MAG: hypothetical protein ACK4SZ_02860 [Allosphingosinicella sp.]|uniref:hypothetical protein n=1 Tax=Allosphingosinicella sp. TaxID=2823234 RepID=UPI0039618694